MPDRTMEPTQASAQHRRLTCQETIQTEGPETSQKGRVEMQDLWWRVKQEIKEKMEADLRPSSLDEATLVQEVGVKEEVSEENNKSGTAAKAEPKPVVKRRRLTRRDMQEHMQSQGPKRAKKEFADGVKVKEEQGAEQEADLENPRNSGFEIDDLWWRVKYEIKEEMEPDSRLSNLAVLEVGVKEEIEEAQHQDVESYPSEAASEERIPQLSSKDAKGQARIKPEPTPFAKRRRLTRRDMQEPTQTEDPTKKEFTDGAKVKTEKHVQLQSSLEPAEETMEMDDLWLRVRKEINKHTFQKVEPSEELAKLEGHEEAFSGQSSLASFAAQAAVWAKQCLAFRSSKTWSPTRPCCPANFFLGSANGTPSPPPADAPACVLRLTGHGLRCLHRFHEKHSLHTTFESEASQTPRPMLQRKHQLDSDLMQDCKVRGLDCMKMWPWTRDLPTCMWAGRGWAFDENGLRQLQSTGGSSAMQGAEVFESVGAAGEEVKTTEQKLVTAVAAEHAAPPGEGPKPTRFVRDNVAKQSGVADVTWKNGMQSWCVQFYECDSKGQKIRRTSRKFSVNNHMGPGRSDAEADAMALQAAKTFRTELVKQGILSEAKVKDPNFTSEVPGVKWNKKKQKWNVEITEKGSKKKIQGGYFTEKAAAEAKALELREQHGLQRQVKAVDSWATLPVFHPKVPYPGVTWEQRSQQWRAQCTVQSRNRQFYIKPKDHSEEELERSFKVAVAWKKKQEKEKEGGKTAKPKVKPGKKRPK